MTGTVNETHQESFALSLVRDDLLYRLQRRIGLIPAKGSGIVRRAVFWSLFALLPIAVWAYCTGRVLPQAGNEALLAHFGIHVRFLIAVPLLIFAEAPAQGVFMRLLPYFVRSEVMLESELPRFRTALTDAARLRNATFPWMAILAVVIAVVTVSDVVHHSHKIIWAVDGEGISQQLSFGARNDCGEFGVRLNGNETAGARKYLSLSNSQFPGSSEDWGCDYRQSRNHRSDEKAESPG